MNRKNYTSPEFIINLFLNDEVITASASGAPDDSDIELPFVPADWICWTEVNLLNKKIHEQAEIKIVRFDKEDVIVASGVEYEPDSTGSNDTEILW